LLSELGVLYRNQFAELIEIVSFWRSVAEGNECRLRNLLCGLLAV